MYTCRGYINNRLDVPDKNNDALIESLTGSCHCDTKNYNTGKFQDCVNDFIHSLSNYRGSIHYERPVEYDETSAKLN